MITQKSDGTVIGIDAYGKKKIFPKHGTSNLDRYYKYKYLHYVTRCWIGDDHRFDIFKNFKNENFPVDNQLSLIYYSPSKIFDLISPDRKVVKTALKSFITFASGHLSNYRKVLLFFDETCHIGWNIFNDEFTEVCEKIRKSYILNFEEKDNMLDLYIYQIAIKFIDKFSNMKFCSKEFDILRKIIGNEDEVRAKLLMNLVAE